MFLLWAVVEDIMCRDFSRTQPSCGELEVYSCQLNFSGQSPLPFKYVLLLLCFLSWMILHWFSDHPLFLKIFYKILWTVVCLLLHCKAKIVNSGIKYKHKITSTCSKRPIKGMIYASTTLLLLKQQQFSENGKWKRCVWRTKL